jgi:hypothetical protein
MQGTSTTQLAAQFAPGKEPSILDDLSGSGSGCLFFLGLLLITVAILCFVAEAGGFGIFLLVLSAPLVAGAIAIYRSACADRERKMLAVTRKRIFLDGGRHTVPPEGGKGKAACARVRRK